MISRMRMNIFVAFLGISIVLVTVCSPYTKMFGKFYDPAKDFTCCKNDQLYVYHYYTNKVFWLKTTQGFTPEAVGKPTPGGCNIQCPPQIK